LWHDAGYDAATWQLLTFREFSHSFILRKQLEQFNLARTALSGLGEILDDSLGKRVVSALEIPEQVATGYDCLWYADDCKIQGITKRAWGRFHAALSAIELSELLALDDNSVSNDKESKHLSTAVALHHEQVLIDDVVNGELDDKQLSILFVKNPLLSILQFADAMSGFARGKLKELHENPSKDPIANGDKADGRNRGTDPSVGLEQLQLSLDWSKEPVRIWLPDGASRAHFYRGKKESLDTNNMFVRVRALWGNFVEDVNEDLPSDRCPRSECRLGLLS
jgi:hypothetical protein